MKDKRKINLLIRFLFLITVLCAGCTLPTNLPINKLPDGNKDRLFKAAFSGTNKKPKYWMYKVTVVNNNFGKGLNFIPYGVQTEAKVGYFEFTRYKLRFNNIINRQSLEKPEVASQGVNELINEWNIQHFAIRRAERDGYVTNQEEEDKFISWDQKPEFIVDWSKADISEASTFPQISHSQRRCWEKKAIYLVNRFPKEISKKTNEEKDLDYLSFTLAVEYEQKRSCSRNLKRQAQENFVATVHYKYSFKKVPDPRLENKSYSPYVYTGEEDPLLKKYGYFRTIRSIIGEDNRDKNVFYMNRWNPNKKHTFYFTKNYPEEYKHIAYGVICHTNKLFAKYKLNNYPLNGKCTDNGFVLPEKGETCSKGICFELKENTGQEFGDIRYSFFHVIERSNNLIAGYGPTDVDPATGEIVAGNVVISTYSLDFFLNLLQEYYKRDRLGLTTNKYENSPLFVNMKSILKEEDHNLWTETSKQLDKDSPIRSDFEYLTSQLTFGHPIFSPFSIPPFTPNQRQQIKMKNINTDLLPEFMNTTRIENR